MMEELTDGDDIKGVNETVEVSVLESTQNSTLTTRVNETVVESSEMLCKTVVVSYRGVNKAVEIMPEESETTNERIFHRVGCEDQNKTGKY